MRRARGRRGPHDPLPQHPREQRSGDDRDAAAAADGMLIGLSDAGAHVSQLCDACLPTDLLGNWVREREVLSLEARGAQAHRRAGRACSASTTAACSRPGKAADVAVFDPATVAPGRLRRVRDFPADGERLVADEPVGMRHVVVNGTPIRVDGEPDPDALASKPGQVLRGRKRGEAAQRTSSQEWRTAAGRVSRPAVSATRSGPGHRRGHPLRDGDHLLRDGDLRLAHRDHADPQPEQRAQRHDPRRAGAARRAVGRHPAVHALVDAARSASASSTSRASSTRATCSSPTTRTTAAGTSPTSTCSRRCSRTRAETAASCCSWRRSSATTATPAARSPVATTCSPRTSGRKGTRYPLLKIVEAGRERRDVVLTMRANNRLPGFIGDLRSQVGAAQLGAARLGELIAARTAPTTVRGRRRLDDRRRAPALLGRDRDAGPTAPTSPTCTSTPTRPATRTSTCTSRSRSTATSSSSTSRAPTIAPTSRRGRRSATRAGYTIAQLASLVDPTIPKNEGFFDCIDLRVPLRHVREPGRGQAGEQRDAPSRRRGRRRDRASRCRRSSPTGARRRPTSTARPRQMWGDLDPRTGQVVLRPRRRGQRRLGQRA